MIWFTAGDPPRSGEADATAAGVRRGTRAGQHSHVAVRVRGFLLASATPKTTGQSDA